MSALKIIAELAAEKKLPIVVSGGIAVIMHGYQRTTFGLDLVVNRAERKKWMNLLTESGCFPFHEAATFVQFNPPGNEGTPVDLMLTKE